MLSVVKQYSCGRVTRVTDEDLGLATHEVVHKVALTNPHIRTDGRMDTTKHIISAALQSIKTCLFGYVGSTPLGPQKFTGLILLHTREVGSPAKATSPSPQTNAFAKNQLVNPHMGWTWFGYWMS